jgi:hypothetical protein
MKAKKAAQEVVGAAKPVTERSDRPQRSYHALLRSCLAVIKEVYPGEQPEINLQIGNPDEYEAAKATWEAVNIAALGKPRLTDEEYAELGGEARFLYSFGEEQGPHESILNVSFPNNPNIQGIHISVAPLLLDDGKHDDRIWTSFSGARDIERLSERLNEVFTEWKKTGYTDRHGGPVGDEDNDLNSVAASLGLSFEEAKAKLTAGRKEDTPLRAARRVLRRFENRQTANPDLPVPRKVEDARSFVNRANYQSKKAKIPTP